MIECKKYHAVFYDASTCIARITASKKAAKLRKKGIYGSRSNRMYEGCDNCKIGEELYKNRNKEKKMEFKECSKCGEKKPLDRKNFYKDKSSEDSFHRWCKVCHNISSGKVSVKNEPDIKPVEPIKIPVVEPAEIVKPIEPIEASKENTIVLDFTKHPDIFSKVQEWADENMRDVDKQILYALKSGSLNF